jgi:CHRD domain
MNTGTWVGRGIAVLAAGAAMVLAPAALPAAAADKAAVAVPRAVFTVLDAANSVPANDSQGIAIAAAVIDPNHDQVCYFMAEANLDTVILAHIHKGAAGVNGPVVVPLTAPVGGTSKGCVSIADDLAKDLVANPQNYYFNIHTTLFPAGAIRGQLARS